MHWRRCSAHHSLSRARTRASDEMRSRAQSRSEAVRSFIVLWTGVNGKERERCRFLGLPFARFLTNRLELPRKRRSQTLLFLNSSFDSWTP